MTDLANFQLIRDAINDTSITSTTMRVPVFPTTSLTQKAFSLRGSIAYDETLQLLAYFDGFVWQYLSPVSAGGVTDIVNIGGGVQVFEAFNPDLPGNRTARFRSLLAGAGLSVVQGATTITYALDADIGELNNVDATADTPAVNEILGFRGTAWRNIGLVAGDNIAITHQATTTTISGVPIPPIAEGFMAVLDSQFISPNDDTPRLVGGAGTWVTTAPDGHNAGGELSIASGIWTAPAAGYYNVSAGSSFISAGAPSTLVELAINVNNAAYSYESRDTVLQNIMGGISISLPNLLIQTAGDTVRLDIRSVSVGGADTTLFDDDGSRNLTWFAISPVRAL